MIMSDYVGNVIFALNEKRTTMKKSNAQIVTDTNHANHICYIVAAGDFYGPPFVLRKNDLLIAADGGLKHLVMRNLTPHLLMGDLDSLSPAIPHPHQTKIFSPIKDETDTALALNHGWQTGYRTFRMYGCTGGNRFSHTLALLQTAGAVCQAGGDIVVYEKNAYIFFLHNAAYTLPNRGGYLSVFAWGKAALGVTLRHVKYPLTNATLTPNEPLGVSNEITAPQAQISVAEGTLLLVQTRAKEEDWWI